MASTVRDYYQYSPLPKGHIRVVRLLCPSYEHTSKSQCHLELSNSTVYETVYDALSYTWGPSTMEEETAEAAQIFTKVPRCYPVFCGGKIILVTKSLRRALRSLMNFEVPTSNWRPAVLMPQLSLEKRRYTWIDGLCINQDNLKERGEHLMSMIYSQASSLLVDLGVMDLDTANALETAGTLAFLDLNEQEKCSAQTIYNDSCFSRVGSRRITTREWLEWVILLSRSIFRRTWIIQEMMLAGRRGYWICGDAIGTCRTVMKSLEVFLSTDWVRIASPQNSGSNHMGSMVREFAQLTISRRLRFCRTFLHSQDLVRHVLNYMAKS